MKFNREYKDNIEKKNIKYEEKELNKIYADPNSAFIAKLEAVILTIYQIRNNLTHGNKSGDYRDRTLIQNSNPILENLVEVLLKKLEAM